MKNFLESLHRWRPREIYTGGAVLWVFLFLNPVGAWNNGLKRFFDVGSSIVCGLIRGDNISGPEAVLLLWILSSILDQIEALGVVRNFLPTHYSDAWLGLLSTPM